LRRKLRSHLITLLKLIISFSILGYLIRQAVADEQFAALGSMNKRWELLFLGFLFSLLAVTISIYRWKCLVNAVQLPLGMKDAFRIGIMGQFFNFIAFGTLGADALRAYYLSRKFHKRKSEAIVTVIADRFTGLLTMVFLGAVAFFVLDRFELIDAEPRFEMMLKHTGRIVSFVAVGFTAVMAATVFFPRIENLAVVQAVYRLPKLGPVVAKFASTWAIFQNRPGVLFYSFFLSALVNLCFLFAIYFIAQGISKDSPSLFSHAFIEPISMVCNAIPLPGGLGGMEFALSVLYKSMGSQSGVVVAFAYRMSLLVVAAIGGIMWFSYRRQAEHGDLVHAMKKKLEQESL
jgi:hypothetical protein